MYLDKSTHLLPRARKQRATKCKNQHPQQLEKEETMKTYQVTYQAPNGKYCRFKFNSDKSFRHYTNDYCSGGFGGLGYPFCCDMAAKVDEIMEREESAMKRNGGFDYRNIKKIVCLDTSEIRYF